MAKKHRRGARRPSILKDPADVQEVPLASLHIKDNYNISQGGVKYDDSKVRFDLMPVEAEVAVARVLTKGASKYKDRNWEQGLRYGRVYAAARRHMGEFWNGNAYDEETGEHVLAHAICMLTFLLAYELRRKDVPRYAEFDDRPGDTVDVPMATTTKLQLPYDADMQA